MTLAPILYQCETTSMSTDSKIALITGASRGLGAAMAEALGAEGWHIIAVARTVGALEELDDRIKAVDGTATLAPMDIANDEAMRALCRSIFDRWGKLQLWVHSAIHAAPLAPAVHLDAKDWEKSLSINARATGILIPFVEPLLQAGNGTALFLDDPRAGEKFFGAYGATKAAQLALAKSWQVEAAKTGPRIMIETPTPMPTATRARFFPGEDREALTPCTDEAKRLIAKLREIGSSSI